MWSCHASTRLASCASVPPATRTSSRSAQPPWIASGSDITRCPGNDADSPSPAPCSSSAFRSALADWSEDRPGFCEVDLVDHSGGLIIRGRQHAWTLCLTDVKTGWTECVAVRNKAQVHVFAAIRRARERLPFPLLGIDSDSGSEFINNHLYRYCLREKITFTRGRAGRRNDNAYVEQKNWSVVRRAVGYWRYDSPGQLELLDRLYVRLHLYVNFFLPVVKLQEKIRFGSKVKRIYDDPQTPYARVLANPSVSQEDKTELQEAYGYLNLIELRRGIDDLQVQLLWAVGRPD
jgi:hypothetical protein